jgi:hypothetical protein
MTKWPLPLAAVLLLLAACSEQSNTGAGDTQTAPGASAHTNLGLQPGTGRVDRGGGASLANPPESGLHSAGSSTNAVEPK